MIWTRLAPGRLTFMGMAVYAVLCLTSMALMSIGAAFLIVCVLLDTGGPAGFGRDLRALLREPLARYYEAASAAVIAACVASLVSFKLRPLTFGLEPQPLHWIGDLGKMWYFSLPLVVAVAWRRLPEARQGGVLKSWILCFGALSAMGVAQFFTGWPRAQPNPVLPGYYHPILFLGHHLSVASIWIFPFFATLELIASPALRARARLSLRVLVPAALLGAVTLILGYSRTLWVALPVGLAAWALLRLPRKTAWLLIAGLAAGGVAFFFLPIVQRRLQNGMGVGDRIELWKANWVFFRDRPFFGVGFGKNQGLSYDYFRSIHPGQTDFFIGHAHDIYLEVLAGTGAVGGVAWLAWVAGVFRCLGRAIRQPGPLGFGRAMLAAWIVFLINGATQVNFWEGKVLHQVMWITGWALYWATREGAADA